MKFIKLNESFVNGNTTPILLNADMIKSVKISDRGTDVHIYMTDGKYYFVKETVEEIWLMLNGV